MSYSTLPVVSKSHNVRPLLSGFEQKTVTLTKKEGSCEIRCAGNDDDTASKLSDRHVKVVEDISQQNANHLNTHDSTLRKWHENIETARAMCAEALDNELNGQLYAAISQNNNAKKHITFDKNKGVFFYKKDNQTAKFKVIKGSNGTNLLQVTISGRLESGELENRIEEIVDLLSGCCGNGSVTISNDGKRTLNLNGTKIILPSKIGETQRVSFKVEHNRIHFQGNHYRNDMARVFGNENIPVNVNEGFSVEKMSNDVWRDQCMRQVKSMISPTVTITDEPNSGNGNGSIKDIKAPVSCYLNLLSMNLMLNSILNSSDDSDNAGQSVVAPDGYIVSIADNLSSVINDEANSSFESWKKTLENIHNAYDNYTERIKKLKGVFENKKTFVAEEAVLRQHEALLRKLFVEATNRAKDVLKLDISSKESNITFLDKEEISDMEFPSASNNMSDVIKMFEEEQSKKEQALELKKKEEEQKAEAEKSNLKIAELRDDVRELNETIKKQAETISKLERTIESLTKKIKGFEENAVQQSHGDNSAATMNVNSVNYVNGVHGMQPVSEDMKDKVEELENQYAELKKRCEEQEREIARLSQELDGLKAERDEWKSKYEEKEKELSEVDKALKGANAAAEKLRKTREEAENQLKDMQLAFDNSGNDELFNEVDEIAKSFGL